MISAGRVLIMPKGEYDASTTYSMLDLVSYNGSSYVAKRSTTGNLPTNTTYWQLSAYGGSAANMAANFAQIETTDYASRAYSQGDYLVNKDGQFCKVIIAIAIGDEINLTNTETTTVEEVIEDLTTYVDGLDAENAKITGKTAITTQTDLHTLGVGNYFKANTSVYVTNAPTGIDSVPTAIFRLTVENINNASGDTTKILTLRTFDGKTYTQAYDGTTWSDWKLLGDNADVPTYTGATSVAPGVKGLVPAAAAGDNEKFFKGDGTYEALGTAARKNSTDAVTSGSTDLVESGTVASALATKVNISAGTKNASVNFSSTDWIGLNVQDQSTDNWRHILFGDTRGITFADANYQSKWALVPSKIGVVETIGGASSKAYSKNHFIFGNDGYIYRALSNISSGDTLSVSGNVEIVSTTILEKLVYGNSVSDMSSKSISSFTIQPGQTYLATNVVTGLPSDAVKVCVELHQPGNIGLYVELIKGVGVRYQPFGGVFECALSWTGTNVSIGYIVNNTSAAMDISGTCYYV